LTSNIPAEELEKLVFAAIKGFLENDLKYRDLVEKEYGTTNDRGEDYPMIADNTKQMIDYLGITFLNLGQQ